MSLNTDSQIKSLNTLLARFSATRSLSGMHCTSCGQICPCFVDALIEAVMVDLRPLYELIGLRGFDRSWSRLIAEIELIDQEPLPAEPAPEEDEQGEMTYY